MSFIKKSVYLSILYLFFIHAISPSYAVSDSFASWIEKTKKEALSKGISSQTVYEAFATVKPLNRVLELDKKQPEGKMTFSRYKRNVISAERINKGRQLLKKHKQILKEIEYKYGVPPQYIVALWGIETSYGTYTGGFNVIPALATLAYDGRRGKFFKSELFNALKILDSHHVSLKNMKGSWAGAMGQCQFMPSSFNAYAVDYNGDGKKDIWGTKEDIFASMSNYLNKNGWKKGERWGRRVTLPNNFPKKNEGLKVKKTIWAWRKMGLRLPNGEALPVVKNMKASVVIPEGGEGEAFLIYDNYRTIMDWNRSVYFATSVGLLADLIAQ